MTSHYRSIAVFLTAWMFVFSMLSTCYCGPVAGQMQPKLAKHDCCHKEQKHQTCSHQPQIENFENIVSSQNFDQQTNPHLLSFDLFSFDSKVNDFQPIAFDPVLFSSPPPQLFVLHHAFLI